MKDEDLSQSTRAADREERDRRKRMEERQKLYNETFVLNKDALLDSLPLDFDPVNKKVFVQVKKLAQDKKSNDLIK
jgi:transcriptional regulator ATRX